MCEDSSVFTPFLDSSDQHFMYYSILSPASQTSADLFNKIKEPCKKGCEANALQP